MPISYQCRGRRGQIISCARRTLGLSVTDVLDAMAEALAPMDRSQLLKIEDGSIDPDVHQWATICEVLFLDLDCWAIGYSENLHVGRVKYAISQRQFSLPVNSALIVTLRRHNFFQRISPASSKQETFRVSS